MVTTEKMHAYFDEHGDLQRLYLMPARFVYGYLKAYPLAASFANYACQRGHIIRHEHTSNLFSFGEIVGSGL
jgi:hypothetical protein